MEKSTKSEANNDLTREQSATAGEIFSLANSDPALGQKIELLNNAIDEIGFTGYHAKLFCLNGFGYAADSLLNFLPSITAANIVAEFNASYTRAGQLSLYTGLLVGSLFWGISADIIGRRLAFNLTLLLTSIFAVVAGAAPNYETWAAFNALSAFAAGGNLVLDTTVFLEYVPSSKTWVVTMMAAWWGVGLTLGGFIAWGFLPNFSCASDALVCTKSENMGWRYVYFTAGAVVLALSVLRWTVVRFHETPKFSLCQNKDEQVVKTLSMIATKYNRPMSLTVEQLRACGEVKSAHASSSASFSELAVHYKGLFLSHAETLSTSLVWASWAFIGLAYPLFYIFLPEYLESRGAQLGETSTTITWRNYTITNLTGIFGPVIASQLCRTRLLGRKYTMAIGAVISMIFLFAYTAVRNAEENLGFSCAIGIAINIYYGTLYAYTPEVLPSAHRATGNGTAIAFNRFMGIMSVVIATFGDTSTSVPVYVCAALFGVLAAIAVCFPFEPARGRSV
ncbi:membrane transporter [Diaporthe sp. PMI_573]|nr:membrane transporter [Diaporthaceae sp. PMI_573]